MQLTAQTRYVLSTDTIGANHPAQGIYEITGTAGIASLRTFIYTTVDGTATGAPIVINTGVFTGDTHNLTGHTTTIDNAQGAQTAAINPLGTAAAR